MKLHKNLMLLFSATFMTRVQEASQKSNALFFSNIHDPGYTELHKNLMLQFSPTTSQKSNASIFSEFHDPGTQNFKKIKCFIFFQFSWPVHETSQKSNASFFSNFHDPGYTKLHKNLMLQFSPTFMTRGTRNFTKILLSSTRFRLTCAFVGNCANKVGPWKTKKPKQLTHITAILIPRQKSSSPWGLLYCKMGKTPR
jgi:hypothetical protein